MFFSLDHFLSRPEQKRSAAHLGAELLRVVGQHALQQDHGGHHLHRQAVRNGEVGYRITFPCDILRLDLRAFK